MHPIVLFSSQLRVAAKCFVAQHRHPIMYIRHRDREHHHSAFHTSLGQTQRAFSSTAERRAAEDPDNIIAQLQSSPIMKKIADKPECLKALQQLAEVLKESKVDLVPGKPLGMVDMMRLASNQKFRDGVKGVMDELKKAGIEINRENAFELFGVRKP